MNLDNDIHNCGACGNVCPGPNPFCDFGVCAKPPCNVAGGCGAAAFCCNDQCCATGELCCDVPGPISFGAKCTPPTAEGTCPLGCPGCVCASPDTPIATPSGERRIAELAPGDLVYTARDNALVAAPILQVNRVPVRDHHVMRISLASGAVLEISPKHPTADGRLFADLRAGDTLDGLIVTSAELIAYSHEYTYDILPDSETGTYVAGGALIGSTLH